MSGFRRFAARIAGLFRRAARDGDLADEFASHIQLETDENARRGMPPEEARRMALLRSGGMEAAKEAYRDQRGLPWLDQLARDTSFAARSFRKSPGLSASIVLILALAIGASTTVFSVVNGVLLDPLPFANADRLVWTVNRGRRPYDAMSPPDYADWGRLVTSFESVGTWTESAATLTGGLEPAHLSVADVSRGWFSMLGAPLALGRGFRPGEEGVGAPKVAVLSDALWRTQFGADPGVVGRTVDLDGTPYTVVGVASRQFDFPEATDLWRPLAVGAIAQCRGCRIFHGPLALLKRGVTFSQAGREAQVVAADLRARYPAPENGVEYDIQPLRAHLEGDTRTPLIVLLAAVGSLLLIACANIATLLLARAANRETEFGIRLALGAGGRRMASQLLAESLLLALVGGAMGVVLAVLGVHEVVAAQMAELPHLGPIAIDWRVIAFTLAITVATGVLFGLAPAFHAAGTDPVRSLGAGTRGTSATRNFTRMRRGLVAAELALVVPLVVGASLLGKSFGRLVAVDPGFDASHVVRFDLTLPGCGSTWAPDTTCANVQGPRYDSPEVQSVFSSELLRRLRAMPGTRSAAIAMGAPFTAWAHNQSILGIEGAAPPPEGSPNVVELKMVSPGYFATLGVPVLRGRAFDAGDRWKGRPVAIVSDGTVKAYFAGENPIGKTLNGWGEVVGVVGDTKTEGLNGAPEPAVYVPYAQHPAAWMTVLVHSAEPVSVVMADARAQVAAIDNTLPVFHMMPYQEAVDASAAPAGLAARVVSGFASIALLLAVIGIYGLMAFTVRARERELGIRVALGAQGRDVVALVIGDGIPLIVAGMSIGLLLTLVGSRVLRGYLYAVTPRDPVTYAVACAALVVVALVANWIPALRAGRIDPTITMRAE